MNSSLTYVLTILLMTGFAHSLGAIEVYQWTDENGVVHFSQWAPDEQLENVQTVRVEGGQDAANGLGISEEDDPEGFRLHREQMDELWAEREARREAARERKAQAAKTEFVYLRPESEYAYQYPFVFPGYGNRPPHRPGRPPNRPKPLPGIEPEPAPATATWKRP